MTPAPGRLAGKKALVTGAAGAIGRAIAERFLAEGASVVVSDLDGERAEKTAAALAAGAPGRVHALQQDVTGRARWQSALDAAEALMGGLNVLVNSAGICVPASIEDADFGDWDRTIAVNLDSVFAGMKLAMPHLRRGQPASIVNVSSISGLVAGHNMAAYNASKAAVWLLTKSAALAAARKGDDIRVNSIHPAFIEGPMLDDLLDKGGDAARRAEITAKLTRQIPLGRLGAPLDVAHAAVYLASDESRFMTASEIKLDGGLSAG